MSELNRLFEGKLTENGDEAFTTTGDVFLDILFGTEYLTAQINKNPAKYAHHFEMLKKENPEFVKYFAMFIRDPRYGLGRRDLGRALFAALFPLVSFDEIVGCGRYDDLFYAFSDNEEVMESVMCFSWDKLVLEDYFAKKWMPRLHTKRDAFARKFCNRFGISHKEYGKLIKCDTVENALTNHRIEMVDFEKVPSLAMLKYYKRFAKELRFQDYLRQVKEGKKKINTACTTVYDIYRNLKTLGDTADILFDKLEKIEISCIPVVDTSGSMSCNDNIGRALSIGYYLSRCSTYCKNQFITFSTKPELVRIDPNDSFGAAMYKMRTADWGFNTDFGKVMKLLSSLRTFPDYIVVLTDMEWDYGSSQSTRETMQIFDEYGAQTKVVYWNFNDRNMTVNFQNEEPRVIYMSGYSPFLLKYLSVGFDGKKFLNKLVSEYKSIIETK